MRLRGLQSSINKTKLKGSRMNTIKNLRASPCCDGFYIENNDAIFAAVRGPAEQSRVCAPLFAAAPEMLEALKFVMACLNQNAVFPADITWMKKHAQEAINKAGGGA